MKTITILVDIQNSVDFEGAIYTIFTSTLMIKGYKFTVYLYGYLTSTSQNWKLIYY